jgi:cytochrome b6-f complex iron-sulfur subunit
MITSMLKTKLPTNKISRKNFLKRISLILLIPIFWLWDSSVKQTIKMNNEADAVFIPADLPEGIIFFDKVVVVKQNDKLKIFSTSCTHLGCRIKKAEEGKFICPCHGSEFNIKGEAIKGPASKPLKLLSYKFTSDKKQIKIINA